MSVSGFLQSRCLNTMKQLKILISLVNDCRRTLLICLHLYSIPFIVLAKSQMIGNWKKCRLIWRETSL